MRKNYNLFSNEVRWGCTLLNEPLQGKTVESKNLSKTDNKNTEINIEEALSPKIKAFLTID